MNDELSKKFNTWMSAVAHAAVRHCIDEEGMYHGRDGALRFGRECGYALPDFGDYGIQNIGSTYSAICVIAYALKPPVNASEWFDAMRDGYMKELHRRENGQLA